MKIEDRHEAPPPRSPRDDKRFHQVLERVPTPPARRPPPGGALATNPPGLRAAAGTLAGTSQVSSRGAFAGGEHLGQVRQGLSAEAHRLQGVRGEAHQGAQERIHHRLTELLAGELSRESAAPRAPPRERAGGHGPEALPMEPGEPRRFPAEPRLEGGPAAGAVAVGAAPRADPPETRAQALVALIEKIEVLVRAQRPALAMRVGGALEATVEVERTGVREVALRIQGHRGPLRAEELTRLREALTARGLTLRSLSST